MLYTTEVELAPGTVVRSVLLAKVELDGEPIFLDFKAIMGDDSVIPYIMRYGDRVNIDSVVLPDNSVFIVPVVPDNNPITPINCGPFYKFFMANPNFADFEAMQEKVNNPNFDVTALKALKGAILDFNKYIRGELSFKINAPETFFLNAVRTLAAVRDHNGRLGHQFVHINAQINKTNFMNSETDQFFIKFPDYDRLQSSDISVDALVPDPEEIAKPYPHPIYYTPFYKTYFSETTASGRRAVIDKARQFVEITTQQENDVPKIDIRRVEGASSNNDLDIQSNEREYYEALREYIRFDISQAFSLNKEEDIDDKYKRCECSPRLLYYLRSILETLLLLNWKHTGKIKDYSIPDFNEDEEGEVEEGGFIHIGQDLDELTRDALETTHNFIVYAASHTGMGFDAYVEAIIKLARWGSVKPSVLKIGKFNWYLDLNNLYMRNTTGNLENSKPVLVDGYELQFKSFIIFDDRVRDTEFRNKYGAGSKVNIPVGLECEKLFEGGASQKVYFSFIDLIQEFRRDPNIKLVKGIYFDGNKFSSDIPAEKFNEFVTLRIANERVSTDVDSLFVYRTSCTTKELMLTLNVRGIENLSILNEFLPSENKLTNWYPQLKFSSKEELISKVSINPFPAEALVRTNVANLIVPIVLKASETFGDNLPTMDNVLNVYKNVMDELNFVSEGQFLGNGGEYTSKVFSETEQKMSSMMAFSKPNEQADQNSEDFLTRANRAVISPIHPNENTLGIMDGDNMIGTVVVREGETKTFVIGGKDTITTNTRPSANTVKALFPLILDTLHKILMGDLEKVRVKFHDVETIKYYTNLLNEQNKAAARQASSKK